VGRRFYPLRRARTWRTRHIFLIFFKNTSNILEYFLVRWARRSTRRGERTGTLDAWAGAQTTMPSMQPFHLRDLLSLGDGNYNFHEEEFKTRTDSKDAVLDAYQNHRHDNSRNNILSDSNIGWRNGAWTAWQNLQRPPPPCLPSQSRH
jgi:hypothetical protein